MPSVLKDGAASVVEKEWPNFGGPHQALGGRLFLTWGVAGRSRKESLRLARISGVCVLLPCYLGEFFFYYAASGVRPRPTVSVPFCAPFWLPSVSRLQFGDS